MVYYYCELDDKDEVRNDFVFFSIEKEGGKLCGEDYSSRLKLCNNDCKRNI